LSALMTIVRKPWRARNRERHSFPLIAPSALQLSRTRHNYYE
jgi:CRISPR-associated Cas5-like protein